MRANVTLGATVVALFVFVAPGIRAASKDRRGAILAMTMAALVAVVGCGGGSEPIAPFVTSTPNDSRVVELSSSASVMVTPSDEADPRVLASVAPLPPTLRLEPNQSASLRAIPFDGRGLQKSGLRLEWEVIDSGAGSMVRGEQSVVNSDKSNVKSDKSDNDSPFTTNDSLLTTDDSPLTTHFLAGGRPGLYEDALRVTAFEATDAGVRTASATVDVEITQPDPDRRIASVEPVTGVVHAAQGQLVRLQGVGYDPLGRILPETRMDWDVADPDVGSMTAPGFLSVRAEPGTYPEALTLRGSLDDATVETRVTLNVVSSESGQGEAVATILPRSVRLVRGAEFRFDSVAVDPLGQAVRTKNVSWRVTDPNAGWIDDQGVFHAGEATGAYPNAIEVTTTTVRGGEETVKRAHASVTIRSEPQPSVLTSADIAPARSVVARGQTTLFRAIPRDGDGKSMGVAASYEGSIGSWAVGRGSNDESRIANNDDSSRTTQNPQLTTHRDGVTVHWEVLNPEVGTINSLGQFKATGKPGVYRDAIRATAVQRAECEAPDAECGSVGPGGEIPPDPSLEKGRSRDDFESGDSNDESRIANNDGSRTTHSSQPIARTATADVVITGDMARIEVTPDQAVLKQGEIVFFRARAYDQNGVAIPGVLFDWSVANPKAGSIGPAGDFRAAEPGEYPGTIQVTARQRVPR